MTEIHSFDQMSDTARWLVCKITARVPQEVWELNPVPYIEILVNGHPITGVDNKMFEEWATAINNYANDLATEKLLARFHEALDVIWDQLEVELRVVLGL